MHWHAPPSQEACRADSSQLAIRTLARAAIAAPQILGSGPPLLEPILGPRLERTSHVFVVGVPKNGPGFGSTFGPPFLNRWSAFRRPFSRFHACAWALARGAFCAAFARAALGEQRALNGRGGSRGSATPPGPLESSKKPGPAAPPRPATPAPQPRPRPLNTTSPAADPPRSVSR